MEPSALHQLDVSRRAHPNGGRRHRHTSMLQPPAAIEGLWASPVQAQPLRIAVLDHDRGFLIVLAKRLERLDWKHRVLTPTVPIKTIASMPIDALVVDLGIMGPRCWDWLERLDHARRDFGIVVCTSSSTIAERVRALRLGADDWLSKPCHPEELIARIEVVAGHRRRPRERNLEPVAVGEVEIRRDQFQAFAAGRSLDLTRREFELIELLARAGGEVLDRELIYERLWGYEMTRNDRSVDVFVHKVRRKLEQASPRWQYIHTHFGVGYRFAAEPMDDPGAPRYDLEPRSEESVRERLAA